MPTRSKKKQSDEVPVARPKRSTRSANKKATEDDAEISREDEQVDITTSEKSLDDSANGESEEQPSIEQPTPVVTKKTPQKRRSAAKAGPSSKRAKNVDNSSQPTASGLFDAVKSGKAALRSVINQWISDYKQEPTQAMLEMIQFFVDSCGCKNKITMEMFEQLEYFNIINELTKHFAENTGDYPLVINTAAYRRFKMNFIDFVEKMIDLCQNNIIYDGYFLDTLIVWLIGFTDSQIRAFRHTCTLACCKIVTSLIKIANTARNDLDIAQRQLDAEKKKTARNQAAAKIEMLETKLSELQKNITELESKMSDVFTGVFVHRYRDSYYEIRALCINELGVWMNYYSHYFLADNYTKYIGWMLYDKSGDVRLQALIALHTLYSCEEYPTHLEAFTFKFKERMLSMKLDVEASVAVQAINLCSVLLQLDLLNSEECTDICELVFMENRGISHAAGQFLCQYLLSDEFIEKAKTMKVNPGERRPSEAHIILKELLRFFTEAKIHEHAPYFVDALWDYTPVLKNWQAMTQLLLDEPSCSMLTLGDEEETALVEIMCCAIQRAIGTNHPPGRGKPRTGPRDKKHLQSVKEELSLHFMTELPALLVKYSMDIFKVTNLVTIPQHFDYLTYVEHRLQKQLEDLMQALRDILLKHSDQEILNNCATTLKCLLDADLPQKMSLEIIRNEIIEEVIVNLRQSLQNGIPSTSEEDSEEMFDLIVTLRRLKALSISFNLSDKGLSTELWSIVKELQADDQCDEIVCTTLSCIMFNVLWLMHTIDPEDPDKAMMRNAKAESCQLIDNCHELLQLGTRDVQKEAYTILCDVLIVFSRNLRATAVLLAPLAFVPNDAFQRHVRDYVICHVFTEMEQLEQEISMDDDEQYNEEKSIALAKAINDRRVALAGYLKLIVFNVFDMPLAAPVLTHYVKHFDNFGDVIKYSLSKFREGSPSHWYQPILLALQQEFEHVRELNSGSVDRRSAEWADTKDLARRFSLMFGFDVAKARQPLVGLHREGIAYALEGLDKLAPPTDAPYNLDFLEILTELSSRLLEVDRSGNKGLLVYLNDQLPNDVPLDDDDWQSLVIYRASLGAKRSDDTSINIEKKDKAVNTTKQGKATVGRKKQSLEEPNNQETSNTRKSNRKRKLPPPAAEESEQSDHDTTEDVEVQEDSDGQGQDNLSDKNEPTEEADVQITGRPKRRKRKTAAPEL